MTDGRRRTRPDAGARRPAKRSAAAPTRRSSSTSSGTARPKAGAKPKPKPTGTRSTASSSRAGTSRAGSPRAGTSRAASGATRRAAPTRSRSTTTRRAPARRGPGRAGPKRRVSRYRTRLLVGLAITAVVVPVLLLGLYPTRPYLAQRTATHEAETKLADLRNKNADLAKEVDELSRPEEIEKRAREDHGFIRPGEESFAVPPPAPPPVELPEVWPFTGADQILNG
jgi:cell division protein FtsB